MTTRRLFIQGLASLIVAPAIVRASSLMPINAALAPLECKADGEFVYRLRVQLPMSTWRLLYNGVPYDIGDPLREPTSVVHVTRFKGITIS